MKVLFDLNHAAHVHFIRHAYNDLKDKGAIIKVVSSDKPLAYQLLDQYAIPFIGMGSYGTTLLSKIWKIILLNIKMFFILRKFRPDLIVGIVAIRGAQVGWLFGIKSLVFTDTSHASLQIALFRPFATKIYTPNWFPKNLGPKHHRYNGFHELAYLHPNRFNPDPTVLKALDVEEGESFFIVRFISWDATHDINQRGFSNQGKKALVKYLQTLGKVFISAEYELDDEYAHLSFPAEEKYMHDALYYAQMYIGEGATMTTEAAILGTPSILVNSISLANMEYLEKNYDLIRAFQTETEALAEIIDLLKHPDLKSNWKAKQIRFLQDHSDTSQFLLKETKQAL